MGMEVRSPVDLFDSYMNAQGRELCRDIDKYETVLWL
jgi:hypothetical protein